MEEYTCIECDDLYDYRDGDLNERMCNRCINKIYEESLDWIKSECIDAK